MPQPCQNVSRQKFIQEMLIYNILKKICIYTVIYAYAQNKGLSSRLNGTNSVNITGHQIYLFSGRVLKQCYLHNNMDADYK